MNIRWAKQNLVAIVFVTIFVLLLGWVIWLEKQATAQKADLEAQLDAQKQDLTRLRNQDPSPTMENIQLLRRDREEMQTLYRSLQEAAMRSQLKVPNVQSDIDFVDRLRRIQAELRTLAQSRGALIADTFAFGFSRYNDTFPCRIPVAKGDECRRVLALLAKQLVVVEKLTTLAITNGVDSVTMIQRIDAEPSLGGSGLSTSDVFPGSIADDPNARYRALPFDVQFISNETALRSFLNSLSQSDWFFNVKLVTIQPTVPSGTPSGDLTRSSTPPGASLNPTTVPPQRSLLLVTMQIDLVEFLNPNSPTGETTTQGH